MWLLAAGCWLLLALAASYWLLANCWLAGWQLAAGCGYWLLAIGC
jgi:hypothetical protein